MSCHLLDTCFCYPVCNMLLLFIFCRWLIEGWVRREGRVKTWDIYNWARLVISSVFSTYRKQAIISGRQAISSSSDHSGSHDHGAKWKTNYWIACFPVTALPENKLLIACFLLTQTMNSMFSQRMVPVPYGQKQAVFLKTAYMMCVRKLFSSKTTCYLLGG